MRTLALTDLGWARAARRAAEQGLAEHRPRAVLYATTTAALLWPQPGAVRFDAPAAANRPGRHGVWQRPLERRRLGQASLLVPQAAGALDEAGWTGPPPPAVVVPIPVEPSGPPLPWPERDVAAVAYAANPAKKGLDRVLEAWARVRRPGEELVVTGTDHAPRADGVRAAGVLAAAEHRALVRRARAYVTAPRREDYGLAQLEALADGTPLVTTPAPGPYAALPLARALDPRLVGDDLRRRPARRARRPAARLRRAGAGRGRAVPPGRGRPHGRRRAAAGARRRLRGAPTRERARLRSGANSAHGSVLATSAAVSHARRAVAMPQRDDAQVRTPCASESMRIRTPACARPRGVDVVEVAAVGRGVDLEHRLRPRRRVDDARRCRSRRAGASRSCAR